MSTNGASDRIAGTDDSGQPRAPRVVVLGGGFGGLEAAFYLRDKVKGQAAVTVVSDRESFLFKPNTIYIPFGMDPEKLKIALRPALARQDMAFVHGRATAVDPQRKTVTVQPVGPAETTGTTSDAGGAGGAPTQTLPYDYLVLATGAGMRPEEIPGLAEHALTIWTPDDMLRLRDAYAALIAAGERRERRRVLFVVPPNNKCSGPLYEMVQMLDTWLRRKKVRQHVELTWTTYEAGYIQAFGPRLHDAVLEEFTLRGIHHHTHHVVERVEPGLVRYANGETLPYDLLVSFPPYVASTPFAGLPVDDRGFVQTDLGTRQVRGLPDVYAVGDTGDFPVKQAFLAFLQADAAAEHLAARIAGGSPKIAFEPTSMCVMEQFNTATFAQVPLRLTGDAARPIEVDPAKWAAYQLGSSVVWRLGKWLLGVYLPWRFRAGKPFHAGLPWRLMDWGLKVMSLLLASSIPAPSAAPAAVPAAARGPQLPSTVSMGAGGTDAGIRPTSVPNGAGRGAAIGHIPETAVRPGR